MFELSKFSLSYSVSIYYFKRELKKYKKEEESQKKYLNVCFLFCFFFKRGINLEILSCIIFLIIIKICKQLDFQLENLLILCRRLLSELIFQKSRAVDRTLKRFSHRIFVSLYLSCYITRLSCCFFQIEFSSIESVYF